MLQTLLVNILIRNIIQVFLIIIIVTIIIIIIIIIIIVIIIIIINNLYSAFSAGIQSPRGGGGEVQPLTLLYTIYDEKGPPFVYLLLTNGTPFTSLV